MHALELEWIRWIQQMRTPTWDAFFRILGWFDTFPFYILLIASVWWIWGQRWGLLLFYACFCNAVVNEIAKGLVGWPRPFHLDPCLAVIAVGGYGFPSGAAQSAVLLSGILLGASRNPWRWAVVAVYAPLISFSRLYLGVHFLTDLVGGWLVGLGLLILVRAGEKGCRKCDERFLWAGSALAAGAVLGLSHATGSKLMAVAALGIGSGLICNRTLGWRVLPAPNVRVAAVRLAVGIGGIWALQQGVTLDYPWLATALVGFWIAAGSWIAISLFVNSRSRT